MEGVKGGGARYCSLDGFDGFVSGTKDQAMATAAKAIATTSKNPAERPKLPATKPVSVVLSAAPIPAMVPTKPWAKLNRPVPCVRSATINAVKNPKHSPADAVECLNGDEQRRVCDQREQHRSDRQRTDADKQQRPATPAFCSPACPRCQQGDDNLRHHNERGHNERRSIAFAPCQRPANERQNRSICCLEQEQAAGEGQQRTIFPE